METTTLGPVSWNEFIGQERIKRQLQVHIKAAFEEIRPLEPTLLAGPPGFGKSTLAKLIAQGLGDPLTTHVMPMHRKALIRNLAIFEGGVLFLDEIHALSKRDQELLLPVIDRNVVVDDRGREYEVGFCSLVTATTERDKIIGPLYDRLAIRPDFEPYTDEELGQIVALMATQMNVSLENGEAVALGRAAGGIPRNARQFVLAARDLAITLERRATAHEILDLVNVDPDGLTALHQQYLSILDGQNGQAGQKTIETFLRLPSASIHELERLLLQRNLIEYTPSGRQLTPAGLTRTSGRETPKYTRR